VEQPADRPARPTTTPAERLRFVFAIVAVLAVLAAVFGIVRVMQQNNADAKYQECLEQARQQGEASQTPPDPTVPAPEDACQRPN